MASENRVLANSFIKREACWINSASGNQLAIWMAMGDFYLLSHVLRSERKDDDVDHHLGEIDDAGQEHSRRLVSDFDGQFEDGDDEEDEHPREEDQQSRSEDGVDLFGEVLDQVVTLPPLPHALTGFVEECGDLTDVLDDGLDALRCHAR